MKIALIGGHPSPAIAIAEELKENNLIYLGRKYTFEGERALSFEYQNITALGIPFYSITTGRLQRRFTEHTIFSLLKLPIGLIQSFLILLFKRPDVVVGFGGYLELPVIFSAWILRIPVVLHEQTLGAGLANRISSRFAKKICISWESSRRFFPKDKVILTGNPIRNKILNIQSSTQKEKLIYITGGSAGAHAINLLVDGCLKELLKISRVIHQTGDSHEYKDFEKLKQFKSSLPKILRDKYQVSKFISESSVAGVLSRATLVVGRAGINTISELIFLNKPCFLIPLSQGSEQRQNAAYVHEIGLGEVGEQEKLSSKILFNKVQEMLINIDKYKVNRNLLIREATEKLAKVVLDVAKKA